MKDWVAVLGAACFLSALFLCGDFLFSSFLSPGFAGYWLLKFLCFLGISLILLGCVFALFRKHILNSFVDVANKLGATSGLKKIGGELVQDWRGFLLDFYNTIENRALNAVDMERELLDVRYKYDSILDAQTEFVFGMDERGYISYSNKSFRTFMQFEEERLDKPFLQNDYENDTKISMILRSCDKDCLDEARKSPSGYQFMGFLGEGADRHYIDWVIKYASSENVNKSDGRYLFVGRDITNEYLVNKKNQRLEGLAAIGKIAHFISHEINQPVSTIRLANANLELLLEQQCGGCHRNELIAPKIQKIGCQTERIEKIVANLKLFGRGQEAFKDFELCATLDSVFDGFESSGIDFLDIRLERTDHPVIVGGVEVLFQQVVQNIISNAIYAVDQKSADAPKILIVSEIKPHEKVVELRISDNGGGCPPEELNTLSDIFYTTKPLGEGSGIGLSLCLSVVEKMGGKLKLRNISGGMEVTMVLPFNCGEGSRHSE